jgi:long-chain acyl-CoA synthetase
MCRVGLLALLLAAPGLHAAQMAGVWVDETSSLGSSQLVLNGAGVRSKVFIKVYVGALYVDHRESSAAAILDSSAPRRMKLRLLRNLDAESLNDALEDGLKDNNSPAELEAMKPQSGQLAGIMKAIGKVREGDTVTIDFTADGIQVSLNGESRGRVAGAGFAKALLKVWLGDSPVDASLKKALLGN